MLHQFMQMRGGMQLFARVEDDAAHKASGSDWVLRMEGTFASWTEKVQEVQNP